MGASRTLQPEEAIGMDPAPEEGIELILHEFRQPLFLALREREERVYVPGDHLIHGRICRRAGSIVGTKRRKGELAHAPAMGIPRQRQNA